MAAERPRGMAPAVPGTEVNDAAIDAAMPGLADSTADLLGWAARATRSPHGELPAGRARRLLATALGVSETTLDGLTDHDVTIAVDRIRTIADQCRNLASQVTVDELTGALRRGAGLEALQRDIDRTRRVDGAHLSVVFIDVDGLKVVNDRDGHAAGDALLRGTVSAIRDRLRSYDVIVRYGGDEFLCVLTGAADEQAASTAAQLCAHVARRTRNSISTGVATLQPGDSLESVVERADAALYAGRQQRHATDVAVVPAARAAIKR